VRVCVCKAIAVICGFACHDDPILLIVFNKLLPHAPQPLPLLLCVVCVCDVCDVCGCNCQAFILYGGCCCVVCCFWLCVLCVCVCVRMCVAKRRPVLVPQRKRVGCGGGCVCIEIYK